MCTTEILLNDTRLILTMAKNIKDSEQLAITQAQLFQAENRINNALQTGYFTGEARAELLEAKSNLSLAETFNLRAERTL